MRLARLVRTAAVGSLAVAASLVLTPVPSQAAHTGRAAQVAAPAKDPVIIVPGLTGSGPITANGYRPLRAKLVSAGYSATIFTTPDYGLGPIHGNAVRLKALVDKVLSESGASKVDLVAHSQGGLISRDYIETLGGASKVDRLTMLATPNQGTVLANLGNVFANCLGIVGCSQLAIGSPYLTALNAGDDTLGDIRYSSIVSKVDQLVVPFRNAYLDPADGNVENVAVQDQCPLRFPEHFAMIINGPVIDGVLDTLRDQPVRLNCLAIF